MKKVFTFLRTAPFHTGVMMIINHGLISLTYYNEQGFPSMERFSNPSGSEAARRRGDLPTLKKKEVLFELIRFKNYRTNVGGI